MHVEYTIADLMSKIQAASIHGGIKVGVEALRVRHSGSRSLHAAYQPMFAHVSKPFIRFSS